jgi:hypothetical protein
VGAINVHEFMSLGAVTERCQGILLGRTTYEQFEPAWSTRTVEDDPGAPSSTWATDRRRNL